MANQLNIVLVHGAWADGSGWGKVIKLLRDADYTAVATQNPLTSLADDVETTRRLVESMNGPVLLVGHSYGGVVITETAHKCPNVVGLVYIAAFAPEVGESITILASLGTPPPGAAALRPDKYGRLWIDRSLFGEHFCQDVEKDEALVMAAAQKPIALTCFDDKITNAGWKDLPCYYQVSEDDHMIPPPAEKFMAERMKAKTIISIPGASHAPMISHPDEIADLILKAAVEVAPMIPVQTV
jgi:pimeloyl-ACP methyl ester carboxylesterase